MPHTPRAAGDARTPSTSDEVIDALAPLLAQHRRSWAERCHAHGLSLVGFGAIALLEMHGPMSMSHFAEELDVALPNATAVVSRLSERGIVERVSDPDDRRVVRVALAQRGHELIREMEAARRGRLRDLVSAMTDDQQRRLLRSVRDLRDAAVRMRAAKEPATA